jgi:hypothetical protein
MITRLSNAVYTAVTYRKTLNARTRAKYLKLEYNLLASRACGWRLKGCYNDLSDLMYDEGYTTAEVNSLRVI